MQRVFPAPASVLKAAVLLLGFAASSSAQARDSLGVAVDNTCFSFNGTRPYTASGNVPQKCNLCHGPNYALRDPEWSWTLGGTAGQQNFCVVQAIIAAPRAAHPPPDRVVSPGDTIELSARGFSPAGGAGAVTFTWRFSDRPTTLTGPAQPAVPMPTAGTVTVTLDAKDAWGESDKTPEQRTILVTKVQVTARSDHYSMQTGDTLTIAPPGVLSNDGGSGTLSAVLANNVSHGTLTLNGNGGFDYRPGKRFNGTATFTYTASNGVSSSAPATVTISVGPCTDQDKDGFSPEGGSCGPIDCNDQRRKINPRAGEICNNGIDEDCNGLVDQNDPRCNGRDCIGTLLAHQLRINSAAWNRKRKQLTVTGSKAAAGATVIVSNATSSQPLGTAVVTESGTWTFEHAGLAKAPCRVKVEIDARFGERAVRGAPAACGPRGAPPSCGGGQ